jgi:hypothetical protein
MRVRTDQQPDDDRHGEQPEDDDGDLANALHPPTLTAAVWRRHRDLIRSGGIAAVGCT